MKTYKNLIKEAKGKTGVFVFGRFNPPTTGHGRLLEGASNVAKRYNTELHVFGSQSHDSKKNPLTNQQKMKYMKEMFPNFAKTFSRDINIKDALGAAVQLNDQYDNLCMVVGSDRVADFKKLLEQYNGKKSRHGYYEFDYIKVHSAGTRDPDAEGVSGMSASKMRKAASENDIESFKKGLPESMSDRSAMKMLKDVRKGLNLREAMFDKEWPIRPERLTVDRPKKDNEYVYLNYETEYFSNMPLVEECFAELRAITLSQSKHNVYVVEAMKETDKLISNMLLFEHGKDGLEDGIKNSVKKIDKLFENIEHDYNCTKGDIFNRPFLYQILESLSWGPHPGKMDTSDTQENGRFGQHVDQRGPLEWGTPEMVKSYAGDTPGQDAEKLLYATYKYKMQRDVTGEVDGYGTVELAQEEGPVAKVKKEYAKKYKALISDRKVNVGGARVDYANKTLKSAQKYNSIRIGQ